MSAVGPASALGDDIKIAFALIANYSAVASENVSDAVVLAESDFEDDLKLALYAGDLQDQLDTTTSSTLVAATVQVSASLDAIDDTNAKYALVGAASFDGQQECPAGTYSLSGASYCVYCDKGSYTSLSGQTSCLFSDAGSYVSYQGATQQSTCPAGT